MGVVLMTIAQVSAVAQATVIQRTITPAMINIGAQTGNAGQFSTDPVSVEDDPSSPDTRPLDDRDAYDTGEFTGSRDELQRVGRDLGVGITATVTALDQAEYNSANDEATVTVAVNFLDLQITNLHSGDFTEQVDGSFQIEMENLAGSGAIVTPSAYDLEMENLTLAANGTTTVIFDTVVKSSAAAFATNINSATIEDSNGAQQVLVSTPTLTVIRGLTKELYLVPDAVVAAVNYADDSPEFAALTMTRFPAVSTTPISIDTGGSGVWKLDLPLDATLTLEDVLGSHLPVQLVMERAGNGSKGARASLYRDVTCTGSTAPGPGSVQYLTARCAPRST